MYKIEISEDAEKDITVSIEFYEDKQKSLGKRFFNMVLKAFELIRKNPYTYPKTENNLRKHVMQKFPYVILYDVAKPLIKVIAVFNTYRNPALIEKRLNVDAVEDE